MTKLFNLVAAFSFAVLSIVSISVNAQRVSQADRAKFDLYHAENNYNQALDELNSLKARLLQLQSDMPRLEKLADKEREEEGFCTGWPCSSAVFNDAKEEVSTTANQIKGAQNRLKSIQQKLNAAQAAYRQAQK